MDVITPETESLMQGQFAEGQSETADDYEAQTGEAKPPEETFFGVNARRMNVLIDSTQKMEKKASSAALRMMDDVYRQTLHRAEIAMAAGAVTLPKAIDAAVQDFLSAGITCIEYKDGRRVNIADYAEMALRAAATRAKLQGDAAMRSALGVDTVLVSQYGQCSNTCLPWQGRVYIDDVFGTWNGERSGNLGKSRNGKWYPLLSVAVAHGLFHPNCRHTLTTWYEGISTLPKPMNPEQIKKNAALEQKQRALERKLRRAKRLEAGSLDPDDARRHAEERRTAQKNLRDFVKAHSDVLRRDPWKEKTYGIPEVEKFSKSDILSSVNSDYLPITKASIQNVRLVHGTVVSKNIEKVLRKAHKNLLRTIQTSPVGTEAVSVYNMEMQLISTSAGNIGTVKVPKTKQPFIAIHNHPSGHTFSEKDVITFLSNPFMQAISVIGNNGNTYLLEKSQEYNVSGYIQYFIDFQSQNAGRAGSPGKYLEYMESLLKGGKPYGINYFKGQR